MLGDLHEDSNHFFEEAWELSDKKYARAQRSLGWVYFAKKNYEKSAEAFLLATKAAYYHPNTWFTLGCCYMRTNQY
jgi:hypothetical protein